MTKTLAHELPTMRIGPEPFRLLGPSSWGINPADDQVVRQRRGAMR